LFQKIIKLKKNNSLEAEFRIHVPKKQFTFFAPIAEDKILWIKALSFKIFHI